MKLTKKSIIVATIILCPAFATAEQSPTETPFYKHATGQDSNVDRAKNTGPDMEAMGIIARLYKRLSENVEGTQLIDVNQIEKEWEQNAARAQIKYSKPHYYGGTLAKVNMVGTNATMIMSSPDGQGVTVYPFHLQSILDDKKELLDAVSSTEYASRFDPGHRFIMLCAEAYPKSLQGCLIFSESDFM